MKILYYLSWNHVIHTHTHLHEIKGLFFIVLKSLFLITLWTSVHDAINWIETNVYLFHFNLLHRVHQFRECSNKKQTSFCCPNQVPLIFCSIMFLKFSLFYHDLLFLDLFGNTHVFTYVQSVRKKPVQCNRKNNHRLGNQKEVVKNINDERLLAFFFIRSLAYRGEKLVAMFVPKEDKKKEGKHRTTRLIIAMERQWRAWLLCWP